MSEPKDNSKILIGELIGYRIWRIKYNAVIQKSNLFSLTRGTIWPAGKIMKIKPKEEKDFLDPTIFMIRSGFYAFRELKRAQKEFNSIFYRRHCLGEVFLWGRVIEHEEGFRSEFMRIKRIITVRGKNASFLNTDKFEFNDNQPVSEPQKT